MLLSDKVYQFLKKLVQIILPALGTLYFGLGQIWHFPVIEEVVGSITLVTTFLGIVLGVSTKSYNASDAKYDGTLIVEDTEDGSQLRLGSVNRDALLTKDSITFKINSGTPQ